MTPPIKCLCNKPIIFFLIGLYWLSTPFIADRLLAQFEHFPAINLSNLPTADAIVILGGGTYFNAPEYGGDTVNRYTLERLRYGARLYRASHLPIAVSGGRPNGGRPEAELMQAALQQDFAVPVRWVETRSNNTNENARACRKLLPDNIQTIYLVTQAWHLPRAMDAYRRAGFTVIPAGTGYTLTRHTKLRDFIPQPQALINSYFAIHEALGLIWYRLKG